jgi:oligogalacturonide lyase
LARISATIPLLGLTSASGQKSTRKDPPKSPYPAELKLYLDPITEVPIQLLTPPGLNSRMLPVVARSITRKSDQILIAVEKSNGWQLQWLNLKNGDQKVALDSALLTPESAALLADDRSIIAATTQGKLVSSSARIKSADLTMELLEGPLPCFDNNSALCIGKSEGQFHLLRWNFADGQINRMHSSQTTLAHLSTSAKSDSVAVAQGNEILTGSASGGALKTLSNSAPNQTSSRILQLLWHSTDTSLLALQTGVENRTQLFNFRDGQIWSARTSQYSEFGSNRDGSVLVGASGSKASPLILLMLRLTKRELPIAEHKSSVPSRPQFTPNSQRVIYQTDRLGKSVIFAVEVDRLVEETQEEERQSA